MDIRFDAVRARDRHQTYLTSDAFSLHTDLSYVTDPPKYVLMHCVRPDPDKGGVSLLADCRAAFGAISDEGRSVLRQAIFTFGYPPSYPPGGGRTQAVHEAGGARAIWRHRLDRLQYPAWAKSALDEFDWALRDVAVPQPLVEGDLMVIDNHRTAHGRTAFESNGGGSQHHLRRSYARAHDQ